jgi:ribose transport system permease protein
VDTLRTFSTRRGRAGEVRRLRFFEVSQKPLAQGAIALAAIFLLATVTSPLDGQGGRVFLEPGNLTDVLRQVSIIGILSLGMTFVILTGGIDLSVGSTLALSSAVIATILAKALASDVASPAYMAIGVGVAIFAGALVGLMNGVAVAFVRVQPFIVTLSTMIGVRGLAKWFTRNENIDIGFGADNAAQFAALFRGKAIVIGSYLAIAVACIFIHAKTVFGRDVRAIGDNPTAARFAGLPIARTKIGVYSLLGALGGYAGVLYAAQNHQGNPNAGVAYELDAIAAVVIGGTRLSGGSGTMAGTIVGTLIMGILTNFLRLNNVDSNVEMMIKAVIIVITVALRQGPAA